MVDNVFLTEKRRAVLDGTSDLEGQSLANEKYRIRKRAKMALSELEEVARSEEIESKTVIEPDDLAGLITNLMVPSGGLTPRWNFDGDPEDFRAEYLYQFGLHDRIRHEIDGFDDMLHKNTPPGKPPEPVGWAGTGEQVDWEGLIESADSSE